MLYVLYGHERSRRRCWSDAQIEDPYTLEQLRSVRMNVMIVRPLIDRLYDPDDVSIGKKWSNPSIYINVVSSFDVFWLSLEFTILMMPICLSSDSFLR